jgi:molybdopterin-guanine dinucleotide biosynthesis protein B
MHCKDRLTSLVTTKLQDQFHALADPQRLQLLAWLASGPCRCSELGAALDLHCATTRQHLHVLVEAGLVNETNAGRGRVYVLVPDALVSLSIYLTWLIRPPVISFVAKSGTGKTTFLEKLIPELKARGLRVGVLKHHAHATPFDVPGKDSFRFAQAGADIVVGASAVQVAVFRQEDGSVDLDSVIARHCGGLDLVLAEGFKRGDYPKIEVHRAAYNAELRCRPDELLALVTDKVLPYDVPQFDLEDVTGMADFLLAWLRENH